MLQLTPDGLLHVALNSFDCGIGMSYYRRYREYEARLTKRFQPDKIAENVVRSDGQQMYHNETG